MERKSVNEIKFKYEKHGPRGLAGIDSASASLGFATKKMCANCKDVYDYEL